MLKAIPRQSVELSFNEALALIFALFKNPTKSGEQVREFERRIAEFIGVKEAISFSSQRAGMLEVLKALDPKPGDEVIVPAYTFFSVPACVVLAGFTPVFVDVLPDTWNLNPEKVQSALSSRTRAIVITHLNGCPADMEPLVEIAKRSNVSLIEDCAQALGATYHSKPVGSFGIGCFSFGEGKNLLALGGGMITTNDSSLAARLRESSQRFPFPKAGEIWLKAMKLLTYRALTTPWIFTVTAFPLIFLETFLNREVNTEKEHTLKHISVDNLLSRFSDTQAALGLTQLVSVVSRNQRRRENAETLSNQLKDVTGLSLPPQLSDRDHLFTHYAIQIPRREPWVRALIRKGVDAQRDYCSFCPKLPDFHSPRSRVPFPVPTAEGLDGRVAYLPSHPRIGKPDIIRIADTVKEVMAS